MRKVKKKKKLHKNFPWNIFNDNYASGVSSFMSTEEILLRSRSCKVSWKMNATYAISDLLVEIHLIIFFKICLIKKLFQ